MSIYFRKTALVGILASAFVCAWVVVTGGWSARGYATIRAKQPIASANHTVPAEAVDFETQIRPILESACLSCHDEDSVEGDLLLDTRENAIFGGEIGPALTPGDPDESPLYTLTVLPPDADEIMPPEGEPLDKSQTELLRRWIEEGAPWPEDAVLERQPRIDFVTHIQPIFETKCISCHAEENAEGDYDLSTREAAFESGEIGSAIVPYSPQESYLFELVSLDEDADELMPPADQGGPLEETQIEQIRLWIAQGAIWPDGAVIRPRVNTGDASPDNLDLVRRIHAKIVATAEQEASGEMSDYSAQVPLTGAEYHMVAIKGGRFMMGSPEGEANRADNEGPQVEVTVDPFWMGKYEVTWDEYEPFMANEVDRYKNGARQDYDPNKHDIFDAVSQPTPAYTEMSFGMGQKGFPAISMTQHAANKYCQWLSAQTGHFYRLPTEAEWEYACRAGTTTAFSFGDDMSKLDEYGWFYDNADEKYHKVGLKKPNPWGLYDMHGNVMEWTVDRYEDSYFSLIAESPDNPLLKPERLYPRSVRGGNWDDDPEQLRTAYRRGSAEHWKQQDPQLPKSIWYHTDARGLGFRIIRPKTIPTVEEMNFYWNSATGLIR